MGSRLDKGAMLTSHLSMVSFIDHVHRTKRKIRGKTFLDLSAHLESNASGRESMHPSHRTVN